MGDIRGLLNMIREANIWEILISIIFTLPFLLAAMVKILEFYDIDKNDSCVKSLILIGISISYIIIISLVKFIEKEESKFNRIRYHVETRLKNRGNNIASFEAIRNEVDKSYKDILLEKVIDKYPDIFKKTKIAKSGKVAISLINKTSNQ